MSIKVEQIVAKQKGRVPIKVVAMEFPEMHSDGF